MPSGASPRSTSASAARTLSARATSGSTDVHRPRFSKAFLAYIPTGTFAGSPVMIFASLPISAATSKPLSISTVRSGLSAGAIITSALPTGLTRVAGRIRFLPTR
jgi:hypothetical protein